ncbi:hypothetical protein ACFRAE_03900 [Sphingobacterium sp. HJSM2_6]|uniref:hypothetical protein n=1 Tax=Sphingobacterium sp. HJSM2_6 TaxID=3366264 RepID=UPI003BBA770A
MKKNQKKSYVQPTMEVVHIELEQGIAAGSAEAVGSPSVNDWNGGTGASDDNDL